MILSYQIYSLFYSFIYGLFFSLMVNLNYKYLFKKKIMIQIIFTFIFIIVMSLIYFIGLVFINNGVIHLYFYLVVSLGFIIGVRKSVKFRRK